jgi:hypothetical protein
LSAPRNCDLTVWVWLLSDPGADPINCVVRAGTVEWWKPK